jgi:hypothetical protein
MIKRGILGLVIGCIFLCGVALAGTKDADLQQIQQAIRDHGANWTAGSNPIWELTKEEWHERLGLILEDNRNVVRDFGPTQPQQFDEVLDWRNYNGHNWVTDIRDQGQCGSCWAFGALAAMESKTLVMANMPEYPLDLSEQYLVSCSQGSCNGYSLNGTCSFLISGGTVDEECMPYRASDLIPCSARCSDWQQRNRRLQNWTWVGNTETAIKNAVRNGPVYVGFTVYADFMAYSGGVYQHVWGGVEGGHAVSIVGWDDNANCWICKNSWGNWGEEGYFRIRKGTNECGMEDEVITVTPAQTTFSILDLTNYLVSEDVGDGDGVLNPGETAQLILTVANGPLCITANDVQGTLSTIDSRAEILDSLGTFGNISGGQSVQNSTDPFIVRIQEGATLSPIEFNVHITASGGYATNKDLTIEITLNQAGFPYTVAMGVESSPIAYDVDGDNQLEIMAGSGDGKFYMWQHTGEVAPGFPFLTGRNIVSSPAIGDMDGNGTPDIVFASWDYHLYFLNSNGTELTTPINLECFPSATPALGDLLGDNHLEAVIGCMSGKVWAVKGDGTFLDGFPVQLPGNPVITNGAALADLDGDTHPEIVQSTWNGTVYCLKADGSILWQTPLGSEVRCDPTIANLDGNGLKILVGTMDGDLVILNNVGDEVNRFHLGYAIRTSPVPANLDADPALEIVVITMNGQVFVLNHNGSNLPHFPVSIGAGVMSSPAISDMDGDGSPDIVFGDMSQHLHALNLSGDELPYFPIPLSGSVFSSPAITDLDRDGDLDIIYGSVNNLNIIDYKDHSWQNNYWNMFRGNPQRTGNYQDGFFAGVSEPGLASGKPLPAQFILAPNYPNPFNPNTTISFSISRPALVSLTVWNVLGQKVATLVDGHQEAGIHNVSFNGSEFSSGVYFYRLEADGFKTTRKMVLMK